MNRQRFQRYVLVPLLAPDNPLQARIDDALLHYSIGRETVVMVGQTFVDWRYVADQMAAALRGGKSE